LIRNSDTPAPNGLDATRIAANEALAPCQNLIPAPQMTQAYKPSDEPLSLADFNHPPAVAPGYDHATLPCWLPSRTTHPSNAQDHLHARIIVGEKNP